MFGEPLIPTHAASPGHPVALRRRALRWLAIVAVVALGSGTPLGAQTQQDVDNAKVEREAVREQAQEIAGRIDALSDDADYLVRQLELLEVTMKAAESRIEIAHANVDSTQADIAAVNTEIADLEAVRSELRAIVVESAVNHYVGGHEEAQGTVLSAENPVEWSLRQGMYSIVVTDLTAVNDQLRVVEARLDDARQIALELAAAAAEELTDLETLTVEIEASRLAEAEVLGQVQERINRRLAEAEALADLDAELSEEIRRGEEEIARRLALAEALERQRQANQQAGQSDNGGGSGGGADRIARPEDIVNVRGIEVHHSIADNLLGLINAAEADGVILGGSGWRSTEHQIQLRMQNCGTTDYLIFDAPAEACYPPTARPATSNHEAGLAVDFTAGGRAIVDRTSPGFNWLTANAPRFGFYNLWSEPWHWSIDGR